MAEYIDKSAVVAEINRILSAFENSDAPVDRLRASTLIALLSFIDTLEVKEVDLKKEIANQYESNYDDYLTYEEFADIAKHFFELGMAVSNNAQKGEKDE